MTNIRDYTEQNRRAWNEIAVVRERTWPGADFFAQGGSLLDAAVVAAALRPGGRLLLAEEHPVAGCLWVTDGKLEVTDDYFGRGKATPDQGWAHFAGGERAQETKYQFAWPLGDIITALANAGLRIESLQEFPSDAAWRFGGLLDTVQRLPGSYLLIARRPA